MNPWKTAEASEGERSRASQFTPDIGWGFPRGEKPDRRAWSGRRVRVLALMAAFGAVGAMLFAPDADAVPGQCVQAGGWGGFCDGPMLPGGVFHHCENALFVVNCFYVRAVPITVDPRGWVPA